MINISSTLGSNAGKPFKAWERSLTAALPRLFYISNNKVVMAISKLTAKQRLFVQEYFVDYNATQAAIRAGYSAKTAEVIGYENLRKPQIDAEIQARRATLSAKLEITQERVLQELAAIGFARATDFVQVETEPDRRSYIHPITGEAINAPGGYYQTVRITDTDKLPTEKAAALAGIKQGANGIEIKLHDKVRALELLGKHLGLFDANAAAVIAVNTNNLFDAVVGNAAEAFQIDSIPELSTQN